MYEANSNIRKKSKTSEANRTFRNMRKKSENDQREAMKKTITQETNEQKDEKRPNA